MYRRTENGEKLRTEQDPPGAAGMPPPGVASRSRPSGRGGESVGSLRRRPLCAWARRPRESRQRMGRAGQKCARCGWLRPALGPAGQRSPEAAPDAPRWCGGSGDALGRVPTGWSASGDASRGAAGADREKRSVCRSSEPRGRRWRGKISRREGNSIGSGTREEEVVRSGQPGSGQREARRTCPSGSGTAATSSPRFC